MSVDPDTLEEIRELLEHGLEERSWPSVEDALYILREELGYAVEDEDTLEEE